MRGCADLEKYVNMQQDPDLYKWLAQYYESNGTFPKAQQYYLLAKDHLSLVRCWCYKGDMEKARRIVDETEDAAAAYHFARQLEDRQDPSVLPEAIRYFSMSGQFNHAVRLAKEQGMDSELMTLALQSSRANTHSNRSSPHASRIWQTMCTPLDTEVVPH
eukprot:SAG11_NODE_4036_length_2095_cov_1.346693_2_plen_160_part_00